MAPPQSVSAASGQGRRESNPMYKLIVLGDGGVGKTALTIQLCLNHFVETYDPTIEDSYRKQVVIDDQPATLEVLDTAGQEEYTALRDQWIRDGEGFLLVYSITSRSSFSRIKNYFAQIQRVKDEEPFAVVLVANKLDRSVERQVTHAEREALARELGNVPFFESSAKLNIHIEDAFFDCARACRAIRYPETAPASRVQSRRNTVQADGVAPVGAPDRSAKGQSSSQAAGGANGVAAGASGATSNANAAQSRRKSEGGKKKKKGCIIV